MEFGWLLQGAVKSGRADAVLARRPGVGRLAVLAGVVVLDRAGGRRARADVADGTSSRCRSEHVRDEADALEGSAAPAAVGARVPVRQRHQHGPDHGRLRSLRGGHRGGRPHRAGGGGRASGEGQAAPAQAHERPRRAQRQAQRQRGRLLAPARCAVAAGQRAPMRCPPTPGRPIWRPRMPKRRCWSGVLYLRAGNLDAAEAAFRRQIELGKAGNGSTDAGLARYRGHTMLGDVLRRAGGAR